MNEAFQAYLQQATKELMAEQGAAFDGPEEFGEWAFQNMPEIAKRAKALQEDLVYRKLMKNPEALKAVGSILSAQVWGEVQKSLVDERVARAVGEVLA